MTVAEWVLLRWLLDEGALAPSRLSEGMGMTRGTMSKLAAHMIAKGLLVRAANPEDYARAHAATQRNMSPMDFEMKAGLG